tara:strand:+ start:184 stop:318 length:135 start_codon:yes stop_codon:yes gene_type:complete
MLFKTFSGPLKITVAFFVSYKFADIKKFLTLISLKIAYCYVAFI